MLWARTMGWGCGSTVSVGGNSVNLWDRCQPSWGIRMALDLYIESSQQLGNRRGDQTSLLYISVYWQVSPRPTVVCLQNVLALLLLLLLLLSTAYLRGYYWITFSVICTHWLSPFLRSVLPVYTGQGRSTNCSVLLYVFQSNFIHYGRV